jgi:hypothetical protein
VTVIRFNIRPHIRLQATQNDIARGEQGLSAFEVAVKNGFMGNEQQWLESLRGEIEITSGDKSSLVDSGEFGDICLGDDYVYFCVQSGTAGNAVWKKAVLFKT